MLETPDHQLVVQREFQAPRELVWKAWTEPDRVRQWISLNEDTTVERVTMDLRQGGKFRIQTRRPDGEYFTAAGTYLEVSPPARLIYTWDWEKDGAGDAFGELEAKETQIMVEFRELGPRRTELILTHTRFDSEQRRDNHRVGWTAWLGSLARFVEA